MHDTLLRHLRDIRSAHYAGVPAVTYDDMASAARRVLEVRRLLERATGRTVTTKVTKAAVATLLRGELSLEPVMNFGHLRRASRGRGRAVRPEDEAEREDGPGRRTR
jgi:hypothetical protein